MGSSLENSIFDAIQNVGSRNGGNGGQSIGNRRANKINSKGLKKIQNGTQRKNGKRQNSKGNNIKELNNVAKSRNRGSTRILNQNNQNSIGNDGNSFQSGDSSNDRINPYKDYVNTAGNYNSKLDLAFNNVKPKDWYFVVDKV